MSEETWLDVLGLAARVTLDDTDLASEVKRAWSACLIDPVEEPDLVIEPEPTSGESEEVRGVSRASTPRHTLAADLERLTQTLTVTAIEALAGERLMLDPAGVAEVLDYGLKALAMSRYSGLWVGMKCVAETMDGAATLRLDPAAYATREPAGFLLPPDGVHIRPGDTAIAQEARLRGFKLPAAVAFARANGLDQMVLDSPAARFGTPSWSAPARRRCIISMRTPRP